MNLSEILDTYGIPYKVKGEHQHATEGFIQLDCPWCSKRTERFRLGYHIEKGYFTCWTCGFHQTISTLIEILNQPFHVVKNLIGDERYFLNRKADRDIRTTKLKIPNNACNFSSYHKEYLQYRGFDSTEIERRWGARGISLAAKYAWSIFIPVTLAGRIVSWTTRTIHDNGPRYINAPSCDEEISIKDLLYGQDYARHSIVVHEGPFDVWRTGPGAVATMGIVVSQTQLAKIAKFPMRTICFDNEPKAQERARKLCQDLSVFPGVTRNVVTKAKDAAEAKETEVNQLRELIQS